MSTAQVLADTEHFDTEQNVWRQFDTWQWKKNDSSQCPANAKNGFAHNAGIYFINLLINSAMVVLFKAMFDHLTLLELSFVAGN